MANPQYIAGRKLEYDVMHRWEEMGYHVIRASGSHGLYDVVAFRRDRMPEFFQCKRVSKQSEADRLFKVFKADTVPSGYYHQSLIVKVKGQKDFESMTI